MCGYFAKPEAVHGQKHLGNTDLFGNGLHERYCSGLKSVGYESNDWTHVAHVKGQVAGPFATRHW